MSEIAKSLQLDFSRVQLTKPQMQNSHSDCCYAMPDYLSDIFLSFLPLSFLDDQILKFLLFLLIPDETSQITNKILELVFGCIGVAKIFKMLANILWRKV